MDAKRLGPAIGPIAGCFITQTIGIKWIFIVIAGSSYLFIYYPAPCGIASAIGILFLRRSSAGSFLIALVEIGSTDIGSVSTKPEQVIFPKLKV